MANELSQFEAKAYKRLYEMYKSTLLTIINKARNTVEYHKDTSDENRKLVEFIADEKKWDYCGIESKTDAKIIDELEKCLGV